MEDQIIEIFGKRVKIVKDKAKIFFCSDCALYYECYCGEECCSLCEDINHVKNRHFVEVDEDGNEIGGEK